MRHLYGRRRVAVTDGAGFLGSHLCERLLERGDKVARIFNTYGPRMHPNDGRVVSTFIVQALRGAAHHRLRQRPPDTLVLLRG